MGSYVASTFHPDYFIVRPLTIQNAKKRGNIGYLSTTMEAYAGKCPKGEKS